MGFAISGEFKKSECARSLAWRRLAGELCRNQSNQQNDGKGGVGSLAQTAV